MAAAASTESQKATILVADDDELNRTLFEELLTGAGYDVLTASDGAAALQEFALAPPDLVLLDV